MSSQIKNDHFLWKWDSSKIHPDFQSNGVKKKTLKDPAARSSWSGPFGQSPTTTFINALVKAVWLKLDMLSDVVEKGVAELRDGKILAMLQSRSDPDVRKYILYDKSSGTIRGCAINAVTNTVKEICLDHEYGKTSSAIQHTDGTEVWMSLLAAIEIDPEASDCIKNLSPPFSSDDQFAVHSFRLCDNVYRRVMDGQMALHIPKNGRIPTMTAQELEMMSIRTVLWGDIGDVGGAKPDEVVEIDQEKYRAIIQKEWSSEQEKLIPEVPAFWSHTKAGLTILEQFFRTKDDPNGNPVKSVLLEGFNGTSKTTTGLYDVAAAMHCPAHLFQIAFSTTGSDICGEYVPKTTNETSESTKAFLDSLPNEIDAKIDPAGSWKRLTGKEKPDVTEYQVLGMITLKLKEHLQAEGESEDSVNFVYVPSPIVRAFREGGVLILDEITAIANPGELRALNGIIDGTTDIFETPEGPLKVSQDCYIIGTCNPQSVNQNCSDMDLSFRDRFQKVITFDPPSISRIIDVILQHGYLSDLDVIEKMAEVYENCLSTMEARSIRGVISLRGMVEWSRDVSFGDDFWDSFRINILNKISSKAKDREIINESVRQLLVD